MPCQRGSHVGRPKVQAEGAANRNTRDDRFAVNVELETRNLKLQLLRGLFKVRHELVVVRHVGKPYFVGKLRRLAGEG